MGPEVPEQKEPSDVEQPAQEAPSESWPDGGGPSADEDIVREAPPHRDHDPRDIE